MLFPLSFHFDKIPFSLRNHGLMFGKNYFLFFCFLLPVSLIGQPSRLHVGMRIISRSHVCPCCGRCVFFRQMPLFHSILNLYKSIRSSPVNTQMPLNFNDFGAFVVVRARIMNEYTRSRLINSQKVVTPAKAGVHRFYNCLKKQESGFRRNDEK
jgi:hypothetical protein